jgi:hypothetical protein
MKRFGALLPAIGGALMASAVLAAPAFAWSDDVEGRPDSFHPGAHRGYYFWHDDSGLHLGTTDVEQTHLYTARLETDGELRNVELVRPEDDDRADIVGGGHVLEIRFVTKEGIDGVNFNIDGGSRLRLALRIDGQLASDDEIFLGEDGSHPASNPFVEWR